MDEKIATIKRRMSGIVDDITTHTVSAEWYRRYVDMDYTGEEAVEIVQVEYEYDLYASPRYMTAVEFKHTPIETLCDELEI